MKHKNKHEWNWLPELGGEWMYCDLCNRAARSSEPKKYYTHKQALIIAMEETKNHPIDCRCDVCASNGKEIQKNYAQYYHLTA